MTQTERVIKCIAYGAWTGGYLAALYAILLDIIFFTFVLIKSTPILENTLAIMAAATMVSLYFGGISGSIVGAITCGFAAILFERRKKRILSLRKIRWLGLVVCIVVALPINIIAILDYREVLSGYILIFGIPSIVYFVAGWWVIPRIYKRTYEPLTKDGEPIATQ